MLSKFLFLIIFSCPQIIFANVVIVKAIQEEAEVHVKSLEGGEFKKLGVVPGDYRIEDILSKTNGSEIFVMEVRKEGYKPYRLIVPKLQKSDLSLLVDLEKLDKLEDSKKVDRLVTQMFEVQRLIRGRNYSEAVKLIESVDKEAPDLSVTKELLGATAYLKKEYKEALNFYSKAYATNADNLDALKMIKFLEKSMGIAKAGDEKR